MRRAVNILSLLTVVLACGHSIAVGCLGQGPAHAGKRFGFPIRVGFFGGWHATADDYDVLGERRDDLVPGAGPLFGLRLGWQIDAAFALELESGAVRAPVGDDVAWLVPTRLVVDWRALAGAVTPIVGLGAGFVANAAGSGSGDLDALFGATLGVEFRLGDEAALRLEGGVLMTDGVSSLSWTPFVTLGIDLLAWRERHDPALPDPVKPLDAKLPPAGCPKGVNVELCPTEMGTRPDGCPDPDSDGVTGLRDACPRDRGSTSDWGCPR